MNDYLDETAADIAALIPRVAWELMDEEQRDTLLSNVVLPRYMKTTADGVALGPTWWAEAVGASASAIRNRVYRLQQSQSEDDGERASTPAEQAARRHARRVLRTEPEVIAAELANATPEVQQRFAAALPPMPTPTPIEEGTAADYMRNPAPDPSDRETDHLAMRLAGIAREGRTRVERFGVWTLGDARNTVRDLDTAMADIGEWRAAIIEHVNEQAFT